MAEVCRRSPPPSPAAAGSGWRVRCRECGQEVVTEERGLCPECRMPAMETLPVVPGGTTGAVSVLDRPPVWASLCFLVGAAPLLPFFLFGSDPFVYLLFAPFLYIAMYPISLPFFFLARSMWRRRIPRRVEGNRTYSDLLPIEKAWVDITKLRGRRGLVIHLNFRVSYLQGKRVEVVIRFREPGGYYVPSLLRNYRGDFGELRVRWMSKPVKNRLASFPNTWLFVPIRAMALPPGTTQVRLQAEILLSCEGKVHTERDLPIEFAPFPEDFPHALEAGAPLRDPLLDDAPAGEDAIRILQVAGGSLNPESHCGVCGDRFAARGGEVRCSLCDTPHHRECWEYMGGCTTYACEGRPMES